jgi:lipopolysaccharide export system protein LptA
MILRRARACLLLALFWSHVDGAEPAAPVAATAAPTPAVPLVPTVIESGSAEMVSTEKETTFTFRKEVKVTATNMTLTCDELVVVAKRSGDPAATLGKQENFKSLIATGNVHLVQNDREATCGRAAVYPGDDKVELTENPVVRSVKEGWVQTGPKMVLHRGERRAVIESVGDERPRLTLPPLKDLGYEKEKPKAKKDGDKPAVENAPAPEAATAPNSPAITVPGLTPPPPK